jgi:acetyltransferase-like isoleucine patch superfamily enzyme
VYVFGVKSGDLCGSEGIVAQRADWHSDAGGRWDTYVMAKASETKIGSVGASKVSIGRFTYGYEKMNIKQWGEGASLKIGSFCSLAENLTILLGGNHRVDWATTFPFGHIFQDDLGGEDISGHPMSKGDVFIGSDVWIGRSTTIVSGVRVEDGAVIAANSHIVKDIGAYEIWGGNPARFIRKRFGSDVIEGLLRLKWWDLEIDVVREIAPLLSQCPTIEILKTIEKVASKRNLV